MKSSLKIAAVLAFAGTLFLNVSFDSKGHFNLMSRAQAKTKGQIPLVATCPDGKTKIQVCGEGDGSCIPFGTCPS